MIRAVFICALMIIFSEITGQVSSSGISLINYLESNSFFDPESNSINDLNDELSFLSENPVDINSADEAEIGRLFFLTIFQVKSVIKYTRIRGRIISPYEIAYIPGFDRELASLIVPFISIDKEGPVVGRNQTYGFRLLNNTILRQKEEHEYPGSMVKSLTKIRYGTGAISLGLTSEKDQGEKWVGEHGLPDFLSGYIRYSGKSAVRNIILGDFSVRFGQGLAAWTGYSANISPLALDPMKGINSILPYGSTNENRFFRGVGASVRAGRYNIHGYISANRIDAATSISSSGSHYITHFPSDGLHNSSLSIQRRDAVLEQSGGFNINSTFGNLYAGISVAGTTLSLPVSTEDRVVEYFDFRGSNNLVFSADWVLNLAGIYIYGESAINPGGSFAMIQGLRINPDTRVRLNLLFTNSGKGFQSFHGTLLGKPAINNFKRGLLANISCEVAPYTRIIAGILSSKENWYTGYSYPPSRSVRVALSARYEPESSISLIAELNHKISPNYSTPLIGIKEPGEEQLSGGRITANYSPTELFRLTSRFQVNYSDSNGSIGWLWYQTLNLSFKTVPLRLIFRYSIFNVDDYSTRIYAWEDDLLYSPVISPNFNRGARSYLMVDYDLLENISVRVKYRITRTREDSYLTDFDYENVLKIQFIVNL